MSDDDKAILELYKLIKMVNERYRICWPKRGENPDLPNNLFLIGIYCMQGWTAATRHEVIRKRSTKRLQDTGHLSRKNLQLKEIC